MRTFIPFVPVLFVTAACSSSGGPGGSGGSSGGHDAGSDAPTLVMTDKGPVQGTLMGASRLFFAIPYAAPPVGDLRWKPPAPHAPWTSPVTAIQAGSSCGQLDALTSKSFDSTSAEDCLTLNIWTP